MYKTQSVDSIVIRYQSRYWCRSCIVDYEKSSQMFFGFLYIRREYCGLIWLNSENLQGYESDRMGEHGL